jgi:hypothetical protein
VHLSRPITSGDTDTVIIGEIDILDALVIARYAAGLIANLISAQPPYVLQPGPQVVLTGIGFDPVNNEVRFIMPGGSIEYYTRSLVDSPDGFRIMFRIPSSVHPYCYYDPLPCAAPDHLVLGGLYQIIVTTSKGVSYSLPFSVNPY